MLPRILKLEERTPCCGFGRKHEQLDQTAQDREY